MKFAPSRLSARALFGAKATAAGLLFAAAMPAQAQFGGLIQNIMQMQQQQQAQEQAKRDKEQAAMDAKPYKKWSPAAEVPATIRSEAEAFAASAKVPELRSLYERLYIEGERNATLNFQRIGLTALAAGNLDVAEKALDAAVARIEMVYADNPEAQKAKSLWSAEKVKDFKGEPYERAMAYFYRGLVYAAKNDFQNARAMFKQADYQDTVAESEQYAGDFALMPYMAGWASYCDGNVGMAKDFLAQAAKADSRYSSVAVDAPVLVLYETGRAPFKFGSGKFGEMLKWAPHAVPAAEPKSVCVTEPPPPPPAAPAPVANAGKSKGKAKAPAPTPAPAPAPVAAAPTTACTTTVAMAADLGFQATTRGGRPVDAILGGKASFKEGAQNVAQVASVVGQIGAVSGGRGGDGLGLVGLFASMAATAAASQTQAQADIREWEQLPNNVWLATLAKKSPDQAAVVKLDVAGSPSDNQAKRVVNAPSCQLYWGRAVDINATSGEMGPIEPGQHERDPVFRREIAGMFGA